MDYGLVRYLEENHIRLANTKEGDYLNLSILDEDLKDKEIFLIGENHGVKANAELRMEFFKYFKEKTDFKYYLCEIPYSMAYYLNLYLDTGDEGILKEIYMPLKGTDAYNKDDYEHWKEVYGFNMTLERDRRISVIGIDIEHQLDNAFKFMKDFPSVVGESKIIKGIDRGDKIIPDDELKSLCEGINERLNESEGLCRDLLGESYLGFKHVNQNLLNMLEVYSSNNFNGVRDQKMYLNFIRLSERLPKGKFFGQIGLSHIFQRPFPYVNWFGAYLNDDKSKFKGKVLSIAYAYHNCSYLYPTIRKNYISSIDTLDLSIEEFKQFVSEGYTLFRLNGENSPFKEELIWPLVHKMPEKGVTTDYFQYLVIINGSQAMEPLKL